MEKPNPSKAAQRTLRQLETVDVSSVSERFNHTPLEYYGEFDGKHLYVLREDKQTVTAPDGRIFHASFKVRGAEAVVAHHEQAAQNGILFASAGNHGVGIAAAGLRR